MQKQRIQKSFVWFAAFIVAAATFLMHTGVSYAAVNDIVLVPSKTSLTPNENFTLAVRVVANDPINSVQFGLNLPSQVTYLGTYTNSSAYPSELSCSPPSSTCFIRYNLGAGAGLTGTQTVLTLNMRANAGSGSANISFNSSQTELAGGGFVRTKNEIGTTLSFSSPDATAPSVSVTAPSSGSTVSGNVTLSANASDNSGTVSKVEFLINDIKVGEDTSSPFSISWNSAAGSNGSKTLKARAYDPSGNASLSSGVTINIANSTPGSGDGGSGSGGGGNSGGSSSGGGSNADGGGSSGNNDGSSPDDSGSGNGDDSNQDDGSGSGTGNDSDNNPGDGDVTGEPVESDANKSNSLVSIGLPVLGAAALASGILWLFAFRGGSKIGTGMIGKFTSSAGAPPTPMPPASGTPSQPGQVIAPKQAGTSDGKTPTLAEIEANVAPNKPKN